MPPASEDRPRSSQLQLPTQDRVHNQWRRGQAIRLVLRQLWPGIRSGKGQQASSSDRGHPESRQILPVLSRTYNRLLGLFQFRNDLVHFFLLSVHCCTHLD